MCRSRRLRGDERPLTRYAGLDGISPQCASASSSSVAWMWSAAGSVSFRQRRSERCEHISSRAASWSMRRDGATRWMEPIMPVCIASIRHTTLRGAPVAAQAHGPDAREVGDGEKRNRAGLLGSACGLCPRPLRRFATGGSGGAGQGGGDQPVLRGHPFPPVYRSSITQKRHRFWQAIFAIVIASHDARGTCRNSDRTSRGDSRPAEMAHVGNSPPSLRRLLYATNT